MNPEVVESTEHSFGRNPASSLLIFGEEDALMDNGKNNYWAAEWQKTIGQGFTMKVDTCARLIAGCRIKNVGKGSWNYATKDFRVSGSRKENGPWETLLQDQLVDTSGNEAAFLLNFTFEKPVEVQFLKFDLVSYWGNGGGLQYFAAIPATSKKDQPLCHLSKPQGGPSADTTTDSAAITTTTQGEATSKRYQFNNVIDIAR